MPAFVHEVTVRFQHTDPAGIVFYPRFFEMFNEVVEEWFARGLGVDFHALHYERHLGVPTVRLEADFVRPCRLGEVLRFHLTAERLGRSAVTLALAGSVGGEERLRGRVVFAFTNGAGHVERLAACAIPEDLRAAMARYAAGA